MAKYRQDYRFTCEFTLMAKGDYVHVREALRITIRAIAKTHAVEINYMSLQKTEDNDLLP